MPPETPEEETARILREAGTARALGPDAAPPIVDEPPPAPAGVPAAEREREGLVEMQREARATGDVYRASAEPTRLPERRGSQLVYPAGQMPPAASSPAGRAEALALGLRPSALPAGVSEQLADIRVPQVAGAPPRQDAVVPPRAPAPAAAADLGQPPTPDLPVADYAARSDGEPLSRPRSTGTAAPSPRERLATILRARQAPADGPPPPEPPPPVERGAPSKEAAPGPDYTGADVSDALRRPFHAIGEALRAYARLSPTPFRSDRAALEERTRREATTATERTERERRAELERERLALSARQIESQGADRAAARQERAAADQIRSAQWERTFAQGERRVASAGRIADSQIAHIGEQRDRERAEVDSASVPSRTARAQVRMALAGYPPEARARMVESLGGQAAVDALIGEQGSLAYRDRDATMASLGQMFRDLTNRRGRPAGTGGGGGSGSAGEPPRSAWGTEADPLVASLESAGIPRAAADLSTPRGRTAARAEVLWRSRPRNEAPEEEAPELLPGVRAARYAGDVETRAFRSRYVSAGEALDAIARLESVSQRVGARAVIDPRISAEIAPDILRLRGMAAQTQGSGVINPSEAPILNAAIPDPTSLRGQTMGDFAANVRAWRASVTDGVTRHASSLGVDDDGIGRIEAGLRRRGAFRGGPAPQATGAASTADAAPRPTAPASAPANAATVRVYASDGTPRDVPATNLNRALATGRFHMTPPPRSADGR